MRIFVSIDWNPVSVGCFGCTTPAQTGTFLDKFVFKNPKLASRTGGGSIMQPAAASSASAGLAITKTSERKHVASLPASKVLL